MKGPLDRLSPVLGVVPARFGSTRTPGKAVERIGGVPMVERVRRAVEASGACDRVIVATDDARVAVCVDDPNAVVLTGAASSGSERAAMAAASLGWTGAVINVQGDLPFLPSSYVARLAAMLAEGASIATLAAPLGGDPTVPEVVKIVVDDLGQALYFSRAPIPFGGPWLQHVGLYGFGPGVLPALAALAPSELRRSEDLEQLGWLSAGHRVRVGLVPEPVLGVDTPAQLQRARAIAEEAPHGTSVGS